jgi:hypothetical protein
VILRTRAQEGIAEMISSSFETKSVCMQPMVLLAMQAPVGDVDRIMAEVTKIAPLVIGKYDSNAYQSAEGIERYRPLQGAAAGAETELRRRTGTVEVSLELPEDEELVGRVIEAIFQVHSYQEPIIRLQNIFTSRSKGLDDRKNPHRWWNTTGDWKKNQQQGQG